MNGESNECGYVSLLSLVLFLIILLSQHITGHYLFVDLFLHVWQFCIVALRHGKRYHYHLRLWMEARKGCSKGKQSDTK